VGCAAVHRNLLAAHGCGGMGVAGCMHHEARRAEASQDLAASGTSGQRLASRCDCHLRPGLASIMGSRHQSLGGCTECSGAGRRGTEQVLQPRPSGARRQRARRQAECGAGAAARLDVAVDVAVGVHVLEPLQRFLQDGGDHRLLQALNPRHTDRLTPRTWGTAHPPVRPARSHHAALLLRLAGRSQI
jgi:hypothetical protein